jgi:hypothetical protein
MKKIFYILATALGFAAFTACEDGEGDVMSYGNQDLKVVEANLVFGPDGGSNSITVSASNPVTASSDASWATVSVSSSTIVVTAPSYTSNESRYAKITIKSGNETTTVTAQQFGVQVRDFHPEAIMATAKPSVFTFPFSSNAEMTVTSDQDWIIPTIVHGDAVDTLKITLLENPTVDVRKGNVTYAAGSYTGVIPVTQSGAMVRNTNWVVNYEGLYKIQGTSVDVISVTVGEENTGKYTYALIPASVFEETGLDQDEFIVTYMLAELKDRTPDEREEFKEYLYDESMYFFEYPKLANDDYIAYAIGLDDDIQPTGYYQYCEFTIDREMTPYDKWIGVWDVPRAGGTDTWAIYPNVEDESYLVDGIEGHVSTSFWGSENALIVGEFDPETGGFSIRCGQTFDTFVHDTYGTIQPTLKGMAFLTGTTMDDLYRIGGTYKMFNGKVNDTATSATLSPTNITVGSYGTHPVAGMKWWGEILDGEYAGRALQWVGDEAMTTFPLTMTKSSSSTSAVPFYKPSASMNTLSRRIGVKPPYAPGVLVNSLSVMAD